MCIWSCNHLLLAFYAMTPFVDFYKPELSIIASSILPSKWSHLPSKNKVSLSGQLLSKQTVHDTIRASVVVFRVFAWWL